MFQIVKNFFFFFTKLIPHIFEKDKGGTWITELPAVPATLYLIIQRLQS